jgi:hypothetical protein
MVLLASAEGQPRGNALTELGDTRSHKRRGYTFSSYRPYYLQFYRDYYNHTATDHDS